MKRWILAAICLMGLLVSQALGHKYDLIEPYEAEGREFIEYEIGDKIVYYHQRMVDSAIVEMDFIVYQFDKASKHLLAKKTHWRDDLQDTLPTIRVSSGHAESMVDGQVRSSRLFLISPESIGLALDRTPTNPCWIVRSDVDGAQVVTIIDAVEGRVLGYGLPPPHSAFSLSGPFSHSPCDGAWNLFYLNARDWFDSMGYWTEVIEWPSEQDVRRHVESTETALFYEIAHGGSYSFASGCDVSGYEITRAWEIESWIADVTKMPFTFLASCDGMCDTGSGSFSHEFRKGSFSETATVGYCGISRDSVCSDDCWGSPIYYWQDVMFDYLSQGWSVGEAFDQAAADYPLCGANDCVRFAGDPNLRLVPRVKRDPIPPSVAVIAPNGGERLGGGSIYDVQWSATDNIAVTSITILLAVNGGISFPDTIAHAEPDDSCFSWRVPYINTRDAKLQVIASDGAMNEGSSMSAGTFSVFNRMSGLSDSALTMSEPPAGLRGSVRDSVPTGMRLTVVNESTESNVGRILYELPVSGHVTVTAYDVSGRLIGRLINDYREAGYHRFDWNRSSGVSGKLAPGVYFIRLDCGRGCRTSKCVIRH